MVPNKPKPELPLDKDSDDQGRREINIDETPKDNWSEEIEEEDIEKNMKRFRSAGVSAMDEDNDEEESLMKIRSQNDGVLKQEEEDDEYDEDEFYDFYIPEVELGISPRKRKQGCIATDVPDLLEVMEEEEGGYSSHTESSKAEKRIPLYLLDPDDFNQDTFKQRRIRRAIQCRRHQQHKKNLILKLTNENRMLRERNQALQLKISELAMCECKKNQTDHLDVLDVEIPVVTQRTVKRMGIPLKAVPYKRCPLSPESFEKASAVSARAEAEMETGRIQLPSTATKTKSELTPATISAEEFKPLNNIRSSRLAYNATSTKNSFTRSSLSKPPTDNVLSDRTPSYSVNTFLMRSNTNSITETAASRSCIVSKTTANSNVMSTTTAMDKNSGFTLRLIARSPLPLTRLVNSETLTPAPAPLVSGSRCVFTKRGTISSTFQDASKLVHGSETISPVERERNSPLAISRLAFTNQNRQLTTTVRNPLHTASVSNRQMLSQSSMNLRIVSGKVIDLSKP